MKSALLALLLTLSCSTTTGIPALLTLADKHTLFTPVQLQLERARAEAARRIVLETVCRAEFEKLPDWPHPPVRIFLVSIPVSKTSPWVAKTMCNKDGSSWILVKEDYINWTMLRGTFEDVVKVVIHELVHVNTCPSEIRESEPGAQRIEKVCSAAELLAARAAENVAQVDE